MTVQDSAEALARRTGFLPAFSAPRPLTPGGPS